MSTETKFTESLSTHAFPHQNIRSLLSLHGKVSPEKPFIIHYSVDSRREELAFGEVNARVHQTANMLQEDLSVKPGDHIAVLVDNPADAAVFYLACWILGGVVVPLKPAEDYDTLAARLHDSHAAVCLAGHEHIARVQKLLTPECQIVQVDGIQQADILHFNELVKNLPNTFFNDHAAPTLDSPTLWISASETLSQGALLAAAQNLALTQAFTGNQRMMSLLPLYNRADITLALLMPLLVGASTVLNPAFSPDTFWQQITAERAQIASVAPYQLQASLDFAESQRQHGEPIWGSGVHQQDLTRFRHLICADPTLEPALIQSVRERLGLLVYPITWEE